MKFTPKGDTLWIKSVGHNGSNPRICKGYGSTIFLSFTEYVFLRSDDINLMQFNEEGDSLNCWLISNTPSTDINRIIQARDSSLLLVGQAPPSKGISGTGDMIIIHLEPTYGFVWFNNHYRDNSYTMGSWIEETPDSTFIASGMAGSHIWAIEIDRDGNEIQRQTFYQDPNFYVFDNTSAVQQAPDGRFIVSGSPISAPTSFYYLGSHESFTSPQKIWGGETLPVTGLPPHVQADGSILVYRNRNAKRYLSRLAQDSATIWDVFVQSQLSNQQPHLYAFAYLSDSVGVGVGYIDIPNINNQGYDFYICRIQNLGQPYNPTAVKPLAKRSGLPSLIAYPTPVTTSLTVHTRAREALQLMNLSGQVVVRAAPILDGTTVLNVSALPSGLYFLRQGQSTIKVVVQN
jgi:predicted secreted protein